MYHELNRLARVQGNLYLHYAMEVRSQYPSAEDCHRIPCKTEFSERVEEWIRNGRTEITDRVSGDWLVDLTVNHCAPPVCVKLP